MTCHLHTHALQQEYKILNIKNLGNIGHCHFLTGKKHRTDYLQCLVLGALRGDAPAELMPSFYYK